MEVQRAVEVMRMFEVKRKVKGERMAEVRGGLR